MPGLASIGSMLEKITAKQINTQTFLKFQYDTIWYITMLNMHLSHCNN